MSKLIFAIGDENLGLVCKKSYTSPRGANAFFDQKWSCFDFYYFDDDVDVVRQQVVQFARELQRFDGLARSEMRNLRHGVDAGIGAPGAADVDFAEHLCRRADQVALHGFRRVTLRLPA